MALVDGIFFTLSEVLRKFKHHGSNMRTDTEIRVHGLSALVDALGIVEAEKFISLILREPFDYTKWQQNLWPYRNVAEISKAAMESRIHLKKQ